MAEGREEREDEGRKGSNSERGEEAGGIIVMVAWLNKNYF